MVLPQAILKAAVGGPVLVELKNGDSYSGTMTAVDNQMNIRLEEVIFTPQSEYRFEKLKECTVRGVYVKFVRFPDDLLGRVAAAENAARRASMRGGARGRGGHTVPGVSVKLWVPSNIVGAVIGKGGETIKKMSAETGAKIEVTKDAVNSAAEREIFLSGPADAVEKAKGLIEDMVRERHSNQRGKRTGERGGGGGGGGGGGVVGGPAGGGRPRNGR